MTWWMRIKMFLIHKKPFNINDINDLDEWKIKCHFSICVSSNMVKIKVRVKIEEWVVNKLSKMGQWEVKKWMKSCHPRNLNHIKRQVSSTFSPYMFCYVWSAGFSSFCPQSRTFWNINSISRVEWSKVSISQK